MKRRLAAILAADVVGYTRLMGKDEAGTLRRLMELRQEILEPLITEHHGRIVKLMGDGLLVEFASVVDSVACALVWQESVSKREADLDSDARLMFRIGINLGDVIVEGADIHGDGVNIAARLEGLAEPGGTCLSREVFHQCKGKINAVFEDMGEQDLKNVAEPVQVYRIISSHSVGTAPISAAGPLPLPKKSSIAVLPFTNMSSDAEQDYFSDGITEDIITALSRFSELFVIASSTSFTFKGKSLAVQKVARQLGVHFIMEGRVRKSANQVRINVQLSDGSTGNQIWANRYQGDLSDTFELQDAVTQQVVGHIVPEITKAEIIKIRGGSVVFDEAHDLAWKGRGLYVEALKRGDRNLLEGAIEASKAALELNKDCLTAYVTLCCCCSMRHLYRWTDDLEANRRWAESVARELIVRSSGDYLSFFARGFFRVTDSRFEDGIADLRRAHELNPNDAWVLIILARSEAAIGETSAARDHATQAIRLSPKDDWIGSAYLALALAAFLEHDYTEAKRWAEQAVQNHPAAPIRRALLIACATQLNDLALARHHIEALHGYAPKFLHSLQSGENKIFMQQEHLNFFVSCLEKAGSMDRKPEQGET